MDDRIALHVPKIGVTGIGVEGIGVPGMARRTTRLESSKKYRYDLGQGSNIRK
jgi:hypothetical protein